MSKIFRNSEEIRRKLLEISSLDPGQRSKVMKAFVEELDFGGVSKQEFQDVVQELKEKFHISDIDAKNLLKLLR